MAAVSACLHLAQCCGFCWSLSFSAVEIEGSPPLYTSALGRSLEALKGLTRLQLSLSAKYNGGHAGVGDSIALLTSLRALDLASSMPLTLSASLSNLSSLTSLKIQGHCRGHQHIGALSGLENLSLAMPVFQSREQGGVIAPLFTAGALTRLTSLQLECYPFVAVLDQGDLDMLLPEASLKQVKGLLHLKICLGDSFDELTTSRALSTPGLTHLDLGCNGFTCLPPALARLTGLVHLDLSICDRLQLKWPHTSAEIIRALPKLRTLDMRKEDGLWDAASQHALHKIKEEWPDLNVLDDCLRSEDDFSMDMAD